jgi:hypothetical protein
MVAEYNHKGLAHDEIQNMNCTSLYTRIKAYLETLEELTG